MGAPLQKTVAEHTPRDVVPLFRSVLSFILHTKPHVVKLIICDLKSKRTDERTEPGMRKETIHE